MPESLQHCRTLARGFLYFWANASAKSMPKGWNLMRYRSVSAASLPISSSKLVGHRERLVALDDDGLHDVDEVERAQLLLHFVHESLVDHGYAHEVVVFGQLLALAEAARAFEHVLVVDGNGHRLHVQLDVLALHDSCHTQSFLLWHAPLAACHLNVFARSQCGKQKRRQTVHGARRGHVVGVEAHAQALLQRQHQKQVLGGSRRGAGAVDAEVGEFRGVARLLDGLADAVGGDGRDVVVPEGVVFDQELQADVLLAAVRTAPPRRLLASCGKAACGEAPRCARCAAWHPCPLVSIG